MLYHSILLNEYDARLAFQPGNIQISLDEGFNEIHENHAHDPRLGGIIVSLTRSQPTLLPSLDVSSSPCCHSRILIENRSSSNAYQKLRIEGKKEVLTSLRNWISSRNSGSFSTSYSSKSRCGTCLF